MAGYGGWGGKWVMGAMVEEGGQGQTPAKKGLAAIVGHQLGIGPAVRVQQGGGRRKGVVEMAEGGGRSESDRSEQQV